MPARSGAAGRGRGTHGSRGLNRGRRKDALPLARGPGRSGRRCSGQSAARRAARAAGPALPCATAGSGLEGKPMPGYLRSAAEGRRRAGRGFCSARGATALPPQVE